MEGSLVRPIGFDTAQSPSEIPLCQSMRPCLLKTARFGYKMFTDPLTKKKEMVLMVKVHRQVTGVVGPYVRVGLKVI